MTSDLLARGYSLNESTLAMGMSLDDLHLTKPPIELGPPDWLEYLRLVGVPGLLSEADPDMFHILIAVLTVAALRRQWPSIIRVIAAYTTLEHLSRLDGVDLPLR